MKECNLKLSKALQELGYNLGATSYYLPDGTLKNVDIQVMNDEPLYEGDDFVPAPRLDDAAYFLLDKYGVLLAFDYSWYNGWECVIRTNYKERGSGMVILEYAADTYEETLEGGVEKAIQIIKSK